MEFLTRMLATLALGMMLIGPAHAIGIAYDNKYGEMVDRGETSVILKGGEGLPLVCPRGHPYASRQLQATPIHGRIKVVAILASPEEIVSANACESVSANAGVLEAGSYEVTAEIRSPAGELLATASDTLRVRPIGTECNGDPALSPSIWAYPGPVLAGEFMNRMASDASFAAAIGNPAVRLEGEYGDTLLFDYPPLVDIALALERLERNLDWAFRPGDWYTTNVFRNVRACSAAPGPDTVGAVVEYFNTTLDHYFYTGAAAEIAAIDAGSVGPDWQRTGQSFGAVTMPACAFEHGQTVVYRFHGVPGIGPNSHFFTRDRAECSLVDKSAQWSFEGVPFWASAPDASGNCGMLPHVGQRIPLYRAWRPFGASNHRFSTDRALIDAMVAKGWVDEGVAMCVLPST